MVDAALGDAEDLADFLEGETLIVIERHDKSFALRKLIDARAKYSADLATLDSMSLADLAPPRAGAPDDPKKGALISQ